VGMRLIDTLDAFTLNRDKTHNKVILWFGPGREKLPGVHSPVN